MRFLSLLAAVVGFSVLVAGAATLTTEPEKVVFDNTSGSATVRVLADGVPVPASEIRGFHLMVGDNDYSHMFRFSKADGTVTLTPSPTVEVGSYDLRIDTTKGDAWLKVYTPLGEKRTILQKLAQKLNISVDELKRETGMSKAIGHGTVEFSLPPEYPIGRTLVLDMAPSPGVKARWQVDRMPVLGLPEGGKLEYLFREAGPHLFTYTEYRDDTVAAQASAVVEGVESPPVQVSTEAGRAIILEAPKGYGQYAWTVDGTHVEGVPKLEVKRDTPCEVTVTVLSEKPTAGLPGEFDKTTYHVQVTPKKQ